MTLNDVFQPNKFGTMPTIAIYGVGMITKHNEHFAILDSGTETKLIPLTAKVTKNARSNSLVVEGVESYFMHIMYLIPLTAENLLIRNAVGCNEPVLIHGYHYGLGEHSMESIELLANGTGWYQGHPVNVFIEDILYRLDLQGKLT